MKTSVDRHITDRKNRISLEMKGCIMLGGPSGCGKTTLIYSLLSSPILVPNPFRHRIFFIFKEWQPLYDKLKAMHGERIRFAREYTDKIESQLTPRQPCIIVFDDLMSTVTPRIENLFTTYAHHRKVTVMLVMQNMWLQNKSMVTVRRNIDFLILFDQRQDRLSVKTFANRSYPECTGKFMDCYASAVARSEHGALTCDMRPRSNRQFSLRFDCHDPTKIQVFNLGRKVTRMLK